MTLFTSPLDDVAEEEFVDEYEPDEEEEEDSSGEAEEVDSDSSAAEVDESETGSVTQDDIDKALGPKFKTAPPETEEDEPEEKPKPTDKEEDEPEKPAPKAKEEKPAPKTESATTTDEDKHAFQVEDANGVTYKITPGANIEELLKEFEPKNNGQIISILRQLDKAEQAAAKGEADAAETQAQAEKDERITNIQKGWQEEQQDLQAAKRIPAGKDGEERITEVMKFMAAENDKRITAGRPTLGSFEDALDKLEAKEARDAKEQAAKDAKNTARKNGALVGGGSAPASSGIPVYKAGSAKNPKQALRQMGVL